MSAFQGRRTGDDTATAVARRRRAVRPRWALGTFAYLASIGLVAALLVEPSGLSSAATEVASGEPGDAIEVTGQSIAIGEVADAATARDSFEVVKPKPKPTTATAPAAGIPDPGTAKAIAYELLTARGWGQSEFDCLVALWNKESGWNHFAHNKRSGAYGIPQALPGNKMASAGADWATNPRTQIVWGLGYIQGRYGTPCGAWAKSQSSGWY